MSIPPLRRVCAICDGGLANRIRTVVSAFRIASMHGVEPIIYWKLNHKCGCEFPVLFDNEVDSFSDDETFSSCAADPSVLVLDNNWRLQTVSSDSLPAAFARAFPSETGRDIDFDTIGFLSASDSRSCRTSSGWCPAQSSGSGSPKAWRCCVRTPSAFI